MKTTAELINDLFSAHRRSDGREYTNKEVVQTLGGGIDPSHLSKLRTGKIVNPGRDILLALCLFFHVSPSYFFPEVEDTGAFALDDPLHQALHSIGLHPDVEKKLEEFIATLQQVENMHNSL